MTEEAPRKFYGYEENLMHGRYLSSVADYTKDYAKKLKYRTEDDDLMSQFDQESTFRSYSQSQQKKLLAAFKSLEKITTTSCK